MEGDRVAGERSLRRAVELAPNDATAQTQLALLLQALGERREEAATRARLAVRLDPLSPPIQVWAGQALFFSDQQEEGLRILEAQATATPYLWMPRYFLSLVLAESDRLKDARAQAEKAVQLSGDNSVTLSHLAILCAATGDHARSGDLLARLQQRAEAGYVPPMLLAWAHMARGETEAALHRVQEALAAKDPWVSFHGIYNRAIVPPEPSVDALIAASFE